LRVNLIKLGETIDADKEENTIWVADILQGLGRHDTTLEVYIDGNLNTNTDDKDNELT